MSADGARWEVRRAGAHGLLVQCSHLDDVLALHADLAADPLPGQLEALAAARTVLLRFVSASDARRAVPALESCGTEPAAPTEAKQVDIDVVYDGEDLGEVARHTGLTVDAVIAAHTASAWAGAFGGFAPGFAYLTGGDPRLEVPRRTTPRTAVPAGAVGLAGEFSAVYPRRSPGGWQLIGRTAAAMWDLDRDPPALVRPGDRVRFRAVRELVRVSDADGDTSSDVGGVSAPPAGPALLIEDPGPRALLQDRGRGGHGDLGVSPAGAADRTSAAEAQELLGTDPGAALVEIPLGGLRARARGDLVLALTGAPL
ncbi:MAG: allophanate hydrolase subunit 1, partial [Brachybacterium sp.]|nr:allophanate hydrolase subunit 1 [Brachybacterium sp.]